MLYPRLLKLHGSRWVEERFKSLQLTQKDRFYGKISFDEAKQLFALRDEGDRRRFVRIFIDGSILALVLEGENVLERARTVFGDNCVCSRNEDEFEQYHRVLFAQ